MKDDDDEDIVERPWSNCGERVTAPRVVEPRVSLGFLFRHQLLTLFSPLLLFQPLVDKSRTMASSELVWQCIKGGNSYLRKGINNTVFSAEPGNLTSKHSFKFSGIANKKTVGLTSDGSTIVLTKSKVKKSGKAKTAFKKDARRVMKGVSKEVSGYRTDLSDVAVRRASALAKSIRVAKASK